MTDPVVFWPGFLGVVFFVAGIITYWGDFRSSRRGPFAIAAFGPAFVGAALAAFAGEHFTSTAPIASAVPKFLPAHMFFAYLVGVAHLAAALSFVVRRYVKFSAPSLALMFLIFVLLMDLPAAFAHPTERMRWSLAARQATFSMGALALFASTTLAEHPQRAAMIARIARFWTAAVLIFYGIENVLFPQFTPGVPDLIRTPPGVPLPMLITAVTGVLLVFCGAAMFWAKFASVGAAGCGLVMTLLTAAIYLPQWFIVSGQAAQLNAINFVFDTLLFAGTAFVVGGAIEMTWNRTGLRA